MLMFFTLQSVFWWNKGHFEPQLQCWLTAKHVTCLYLVKWEKTVHLVGDNIKNMPLPQTALAPAVFSSGLFCVWLFTDPLCVFFLSSCCRCLASTSPNCTAAVTAAASAGPSHPALASLTAAATRVTSRTASGEHWCLWSR